jgi:hypothetical protein
MLLPNTSILILSRVLVLSGLFLLFFNGKVPGAKEASWISCYDEPANSLVFRGLEDKALKNGRCLGRTSYKMPKKWRLVENRQKHLMYGALPAGTKRTVKLNNGRRILIAQWSVQSGPNQQYLVTVLEPNLLKRSVKRHCAIPNHGQAFSFRYQQQDNQVLILVKDRNNQSQWATCSL